jgi:hypothetical protein
VPELGGDVVKIDEQGAFAVRYSCVPRWWKRMRPRWGRKARPAQKSIARILIAVRKDLVRVEGARRKGGVEFLGWRYDGEGLGECERGGNALGALAGVFQREDGVVGAVFVAFRELSGDSVLGHVRKGTEAAVRAPALDEVQQVARPLSERIEAVLPYGGHEGIDVADLGGAAEGAALFVVERDELDDEQFIDVGVGLGGLAASFLAVEDGCQKRCFWLRRRCWRRRRDRELPDDGVAVAAAARVTDAAGDEQMRTMKVAIKLAGETA